jgi:hypothetical protein
MALSKVYTKSPCDLGSMISTIQHDSAITIALDLTNTNLLGDQLTIAFLSDMADWTQVDADVAANNGLPLTTTTVQPVSVTTLPAAPAFATNAFGAKNLYMAMTGVQQSLTVGSNTITFTVPYAQVEISGVGLIGCEALDVVSFSVLDSTTGTYSGHANTVLNQFGYNVNLPADQYEYECAYTSTLYQNMQIQLTYTSVSAKTIGINFILNQVK